MDYLRKLKNMNSEPRWSDYKIGSVIEEGTKGKGFYDVEVYTVKYKNVPVLNNLDSSVLPGDSVILGYINGRNFILDISDRRTKLIPEEIIKYISWSLGNYSGTGWLEEYNIDNIPTGTGTLYATLDSGEYLDLSNGEYAFGNKFIYDTEINKVGEELSSTFTPLNILNQYRQEEMKRYENSSITSFKVSDYENQVISSYGTRTPRYLGGSGSYHALSLYWTLGYFAPKTLSGGLKLNFDTISIDTSACINIIMIQGSRKYSYAYLVFNTATITGGAAMIVDIDCDIVFYDWNNEISKTVNYSKNFSLMTSGFTYDPSTLPNCNLDMLIKIKEIDEETEKIYIIARAVGYRKEKDPSDSDRLYQNIIIKNSVYDSELDLDNWEELEDFELALRQTSGITYTIYSQNGNDKVNWVLEDFGNDTVIFRNSVDWLHPNGYPTIFTNNYLPTLNSTYYSTLDEPDSMTECDDDILDIIKYWCFNGLVTFLTGSGRAIRVSNQNNSFYVQTYSYTSGILNYAKITPTGSRNNGQFDFNLPYNMTSYGNRYITDDNIFFTQLYYDSGGGNYKIGVWAINLDSANEVVYSYEHTTSGGSSLSEFFYPYKFGRITFDTSDNTVVIQ